MCEVCAVFGVGSHWTESARLSNLKYPAQDIQRHRKERGRRFDLLRALIAPYGLNVRDWDGEAFCVEDAQGRAEIVSDLSRFWSCVEKFSRADLDPLDPAFTPGAAP